MEVTQTFLENLDRLGAWGILTTDENLTVTGWNRWLERHSGKRAAEVIGQPLFEVFPDLKVRSLERYYRDALDGQSSILSQRFHHYLLPMPPTVTASSFMNMQQTARISPMFDEGESRGTLTLIEDVTERVATEYELRRQAERLEEANRHKDDFLAMLAHELRNPLAPIRNGIRLLDIIGSDNGEARETRDMIERQVSHMARLVDDLLDVSRIVRGKVHLQRNPCDLISVIRQVAHDYQPMLADNGVKLILQLPDEPCWISGDSIRLTQIVANLLHNAGKFTDQGGEVHLTAALRRDERQVVIEVADTGVGMSGETLAHIFESFSQADTTLDRSKGGLGLGLALVKGLVELHDGSVEAFSGGPKQGSRFTVRMPLKEAVPLPTESANKVESIAKDFKKILLVEDNRDAAYSMQRLLQHFGYEVNLAFSGPEGLQAARALIPDVVICDIGLPDMDGFNVARALRADGATRDLYLIAQTGYGQADDIQKAHDAGFDLHLIKPVDFTRLEEALKMASRRQIATAHV